MIVMTSRRRRPCRARTALAALVAPVLWAAAWPVAGVARADVEPVFLRGDANADAGADLSDAVTVLGRLFLGGAPLACEDAGDVNDDGAVDVADPSRLLNFLFLGGPPPPAPFPEPGLDPTLDALACGGCGLPQRAPPLACLVAGDCAVLDDVLIDPEGRFRNGAPAIALDPAGTPRIVFALAEGGYHGFHAWPEVGAWRVERLVERDSLAPIALATADLVIGADGAPLVLADNGAFDSTLWRLDGAGWTAARRLRGLHGVGHRSLATTAGGCILAALHDEGAGKAAGRLVPDAGELPILRDQEAATGTALALDPDGAPRAAFWSSAGSINGARGWSLRWGGGAIDVETVAPLGSSGLERQTIGFDIAAGGEPHFLVSRHRDGRGGTFFLDHITRAAGGEFTATTIVEHDDPPACPQPFEAGQRCEFDVTTFEPLAVLADAAGGVVLLFAGVRHRGVYTSRCDGGGPVPVPAPDAIGPPPPLCDWEGETTRSGQLFAGWNDGGIVRSLVIAADIATTQVDAAIDGAGRLHVAAYDVDGAKDGQRVRYLLVGRP